MQSNLEILTRIALGLLLLFITLSVALSFLRGSTGILKGTGVSRVCSLLARICWSAFSGMLRLLIRGRRPRIRRGLTRGTPTSPETPARRRRIS